MDKKHINYSWKIKISTEFHDSYWYEYNKW